jgi:TonB family protein
MKKTILCFALGLLLICSVSAANKADREHDGLVGQVSAIRFESSMLVNTSGQWVEGPHALWQTVAYDSNGRVTERIFYASEGNMWSKMAYNYDGEGNRSDIIYRAIVGESSQAGNVQNRGLREFIRLKRTFKYDADGNRTEEADFTEDGALSKRTLYVFDSQGYVKVVQRASDGAVTSRCVNEYGERGRIKREICYDSRGALNRKGSCGYEFDSTGNWIKRVETRQSFYEGKQTYEAKETIYRTITYESSQISVEKGAAIDRSIDLTGGTAVALTRPMILRKAGGVLQGSARRRVEPPYPESALTKRIGGSVVVEVTVDEDGSVIAARALSGPDELRGAAVSAAREWKFRPTALSGIPVKVIGTITFNFNL